MRSALALGVCALLAAAYAGCDSGTTATPGLPAAQSLAVTVGPSPLRRLSDSEYLNALRDLFPSLSPPLPALPPDVPVAGFDNAAEAQEPSDVLIARYESIANLYGAAATVDTPSVIALVGCPDWSTTPLAIACATKFIQQTGQRIFRRPLTTDEVSTTLLQFQVWQAQVDFPGAVQLTLATMLQSPQFIYRAEPIPPLQPGAVVPASPYAMASRLSFFLWASVPDDALLEAASRNELATDDEIRAQAARMLADQRSLRVLWSFPRQWLGLDQILLDEQTVRTPQVDPLWTTKTQISAYLETQFFVEHTLASGGTFRDLLLSPQAWVNGEMARVYGIPTPADPDAWTQVTLPASQRVGLLTRIDFLAGYSHRGATSPPVRGNAIELRLLCSLPLSPPPGVDLSQPTIPAGSGPETNRELFEQRTAPKMCQACHQELNGFGFGFENYNAAGAYQTTDDTLPVDATGVIMATDVNGPFDGAIQLSQRLSQSQTVHDCATQELVRFALGRAPVDAEQAEVAAMAQDFMQSKGDLRALLTEVVLSPSFRMRLVEDD